MLWSLAGWRDKVAIGLENGSIRVWDAGTGAHDATLAGHADGVGALAVHGGRLFSASRDGTIREWALGGTWAALRAVVAHERSAGLRLGSGPQLVSGSFASGVDGGSQGGVRVWSLEALDLQHTLRQPARAYVNALAAVDGEVWGGVGREVVVWGREA